MVFFRDSNNPSALDVIAFGKLCISRHSVHSSLISHARPTTKSSRSSLISYERLIQTRSEVESGKVFRGVLWIVGEYVKSVCDIQSMLREIRKVLGEILILASEQRLLDEINGGEEPNGDASGKKDEKPEEGTCGWDICH
jgi:coatomer subunit beta